MLLARYSPHTGTSRTGAIFISLATESDTSFLCTRLTLSVLADAEAAVTSAQLLLLSQASVFHTAAYTESLFGALSLAGMCCLYCWPEGRTSCKDARSGSRQSSHHLEPGRHLGALAAACVAFTLASCVRSNGKLGSPFLPLPCAYHCSPPPRSCPGVINGGYLLHYSLEAGISQLQQGKVRHVVSMCRS